MRRTVINNFSGYEQDFTNDTGLLKKDNIETYINYVNTRVNDKNLQLNHIFYEDMTIVIKDLRDKYLDKS